MNQDNGKIDVLNAPTRIFYLRVLVISSLVAVAVAVGTSTFVYFSGFEDALFQRQYYSAASLLSDTIQRGFNSKLSAANELSTYFTYRFNASSWPNITLEKFNYICLDELNLVGARGVVFTPVLLTISERKSWEKYAADNVNAIGGDNLLIQSINGSWPVKNGIYAINGSTLEYAPDANANSINPYMKTPAWHASPLSRIESIIMYDLHSDPIRGAAIDLAFETKSPTISDVIRIFGEIGTAPRPSTQVVSPIFDPASHNNTVKGFINIAFSWDMVISQTLPSYIVGIDVILSTPKVTFTYTVNGGNVVLRGLGDYHNHSYNSYRTDTYVYVNTQKNGIIYKFSLYPTFELQRSFQTDRPTTSTILVVMIIFCTILVFFLYDYLVAARESALLYVIESSLPLISQLFPAGIRDRLFRRQSGSITKKSSIVSVAPMNGSSPPINTSRSQASSHTKLRNFMLADINSNLSSVRATKNMFFKQVVGKEEYKLNDPLDYSMNIQTMGTNNSNQTMNSNNNNTFNNMSNNGMKDDLTAADNSARYGSVPDTATTTTGNITNSILDSKDIIAESIENATILFADITGFTKWSSGKSPKIIFNLLESLFSEFDRLAKERGVFKVETRSTRYLAVTGVPHPDRAHVLKMADFAIDIVAATRKIIEMKKQEGLNIEGYVDISVGFHSGPVTAGVLRGHKCLFQIFGDTVNTASRMESNSEPGRIQVSAHTAALLMNSNCSHLLTKRDKVVLAKGKGEMVTYWLESLPSNTLVLIE